MNQAIVESEERRACEPDSVAPPRADMYTLVHKGIRAFMGAARVKVVVASVMLLKAGYRCS